MTLDKDTSTGVLKIAGTLDIDVASAIREALLDCFVHQPEVAADLSAVDASDTTALQVLLAAQKTAESTGKTFRVVAASRSITELAAELGFSLDAPSVTEGKDFSDAA